MSHVHELSEWGAVLSPYKLTENVVRGLASTLFLSNLEYLADHPHTPSIYACGVRYVREKKVDGDRVERLWIFVGAILALGYADCKALACWRAAELAIAGEDARPDVLVDPNDSTLFHVVVRRADGSVEDPSHFLGMKESA